MTRFLLTGLLIVGFATSAPSVAQQVDVAPAGQTDTGATVDYPGNRAGIFIQGPNDWQEVRAQSPMKTKVAHGLAASLSYGLAPAKVVAEYDGEHAMVEVAPGQQTICICRMLSLPGDPVIVELHPKKGARELNGGNLYVLPVVGGSKTADAKKGDLTPVNIEHPDEHVWLIRPQTPLPPGEYALMLGTQNIIIYPFTVTAPTGTK
jgi:hypothetical protein